MFTPLLHFTPIALSPPSSYSTPTPLLRLFPLFLESCEVPVKWSARNVENILLPRANTSLCHSLYLSPSFTLSTFLSPFNSLYLSVSATLFSALSLSLSLCLSLSLSCTLSLSLTSYSLSQFSSSFEWKINIYIANAFYRLNKGALYKVLERGKT